jgi:uncharacterized protein YfaP (DUF2135 family)
MIPAVLDDDTSGSGAVDGGADEVVTDVDGNVVDTTFDDLVAEAGGTTEDTDLSITFLWHDCNDYDLYVTEPQSGTVMYYGSKVSQQSGGELDVDANVGGC